MNIAEQSSGAVEVCCARPGFILEGDVVPEYAKITTSGIKIPRVDRREMVAAMLKSCVEGIVKDPLSNDEMASMGKEALERYG